MILRMVTVGIFFLSAASFAETRVLFLGDSLTDGYGIDHDKAFPKLVETILNKKGKKLVAINAGEPGATSASGPVRLNRFLTQPPDVLFLALGANDGLRGVAIGDTEKNLAKTIKLAKKNKMRVLLAGIKIPTNYGKQTNQRMDEMFLRLSKKYQVKLLPFLLEGVGGVPSLNQPDGIHPNEKGHEKVADLVARSLEPLI